jgi:hypothetical protein
MKSKKLRGVPMRRKGGFLLTDRDVDALLLIGNTGYCTTAQVARDLFPNENRCRHRIRDWLDQGLVRVVVTDTAAPSLVALTPAGLAAVQERQGPDSGARLYGSINVISSWHHCAIVDVRLHLVELARTSADFELHGIHGGRSAAAADAGLRAHALVPDALCDVSLRRFGDAWAAVEVDAGSERGPFLLAKLQRYAEWLREAGRELWLLGKRTSDVVRLNRLSEEAGCTHAVRLVTSGYAAARPVLPLPEFGAAGIERLRARENAQDVALKKAKDRIVARAESEIDGRADGRSDGRLVP